MLYIKMLPVLVVTTIIFICCDKTPSTAGNGSETENAFSGRILYENGSPAVGVSVRIIPVNNVPSFANKALEGITRVTDTAGYYSLDGVDSGEYNMEGLKESLGVFIDSVLALPGEKIPDGILKKCGTVTGISHMVGQTDTNQIRVSMYMPGTRRFTMPNIGGRFTFDYLPEGDYQLNMNPLPEYSVKIMNLHITAGQVLDLDTVKFVKPEPDTVLINTAPVSGAWGPDKTYKILCDIIVPNNLSLTINRNTKIIFMGMFYLTVDGSLFVKGDSSGLVVFTSGLPMPAKDSWGGLNFPVQSCTPDTISIDYAIIEYARGGVWNYQYGKPMKYLNISHTIIRYMFMWGILALLGDDTTCSTPASITNSIIHDCGSCAMELESSIPINVTLTNSIIFNCGLVHTGQYENEIVADTNIQFQDYYNCHYGNAASIIAHPNPLGSINTNPMFVNLTPHAEDYHFQAGSPCIGTGINGTDMGFYSTYQP